MRGGCRDAAVARALARRPEAGLTCSPKTGLAGMLVSWNVSERRAVHEEIPVYAGADRLRHASGIRSSSSAATGRYDATPLTSSVGLSPVRVVEGNFIVPHEGEPRRLRYEIIKVF